MPSRRAAILTLLAVLVPAAAFGAGCDRPSKITMIVGFAPGGGVDVLARVVAQELNDSGGFQVVIENRPGAGSNIAAKTVAGAAPDGTTMLFTGNSYAINQTIYRNPGYATADLRPVAIAALDSQGLAVNAANPARTLGDFVRAAKDKPPSFGFGGSSSRIIAEYVLKVMAKTEATAVPFQSGAPALNALLGQPRRHHRGAACRARSAGAAGRGAGAGGERRQALGVVSRSADAERGRFPGPGDPRLDRHPRARRHAGRHLPEIQRGGECRRRQARDQCAAARSSATSRIRCRLPAPGRS